MGATTRKRELRGSCTTALIGREGVRTRSRRKVAKRGVDSRRRGGSSVYRAGVPTQEVTRKERGVVTTLVGLS